MLIGYKALVVKVAGGIGTTSNFAIQLPNERGGLNGSTQH